MQNERDWEFLNRVIIFYNKRFNKEDVYTDKYLIFFCNGDVCGSFGSKLDTYHFDITFNGLKFNQNGKANHHIKIQESNKINEDNKHLGSYVSKFYMKRLPESLLDSIEKKVQQILKNS